jgi:hypothetical protein
MLHPQDHNPGRPGPAAWPRRVLASLWAVLLTVLASSMASSWEGLMSRLAGGPVPARAVMSIPTPPVTTTLGEQAIAEARRLGERGDLQGALLALDRVPPQDPAYPFARHLRGQAAQALKSGGRWR